MMRTVIVEGPDCAGKTTLIKNAWPGTRVTHCGPPPRDGKNPAWEQYRNLVGGIAATVDSLNTTAFDRGYPYEHNYATHPIVFDRLMYGELIYGRLLRKDTRFTPAHCRMLERVLLSMQTVVVMCLPPWEVVQQLWQERVDEELVKDAALIQTIYQTYESLDPYLPWFVYDFTAHKYQFVKDMVDTFTPPPNKGPGIGMFKPGVTLLVGEQVNENQATNDWPFVADQGSSLWLAQQLDQAGVREDQLYWVNAFNQYGMETNPRFIDELKPAKVVAMGGAARVWCSKHDITSVEVHHPQYWKRFKAHEKYPLLEAL